MPKYIALLMFVCLGLIACSGGTPSDTVVSPETPAANQVENPLEPDRPDEAYPHVAESEATMGLQVALVASELVVGPNRFAVGLFDGEGQVIHDADVHFHFFDLSDPAAPVLAGEANATAVQTPDGRTTIFTHERAFQRAGQWGVEVQARLADGSAGLNRIRFEVLPDSPTLKPGQAVPALETPTLAAAGGDLSKLTSAAAANSAFYELTLAEAMANDKPTLLLFATPAFCQTRFCGPVYEEINELHGRYQDAVNFIHVEVYTGLPDPARNNWEIAPAMSAFGLTTEPWLYLIDGDGRVFYRVEGVFSADELAHQLGLTIK